MTLSEARKNGLVFIRPAESASGGFQFPGLYDVCVRGVWRYDLTESQVVYVLTGAGFTPDPPSPKPGDAHDP